MQPAWNCQGLEYSFRLSQQAAVGVMVIRHRPGASAHEEILHGKDAASPLLVDKNIDQNKVRPGLPVWTVII